jgi:hypothetical protein
MELTLTAGWWIKFCTLLTKVYPSNYYNLLTKVYPYNYYNLLHHPSYK